MKVMDQGAPMITVPAGVLKEFMPTMSRTPTPPSTTSVKSTAATSSPSNSPTPSLSTLTNTDLDNVSSAFNISKSISITPAVATNGNTKSDGEDSTDSHEEEGKRESVDAKEGKSDGTGSGGVDGVMVNGAGVKRSSEEDDQVVRPDLKRIRVFDPDTTKQEELKKNESVTIQELTPKSDLGSEEKEKLENEDALPSHLHKIINSLEEDEDSLQSSSTPTPTPLPKTSSVDITTTPVAQTSSLERNTTPTPRTTSLENNSTPVSKTSPPTRTTPRRCPVVNYSINDDDDTDDIEEIEQVPIETPKTQLPIEAKTKDSDRDVLAPLAPLSKENHLFNALNKENQHATREKLQKLSKKELEKIVFRLFAEKTLYKSELGKMKQIYERLESSYETNRKKAVQFHKEVEDMKKVTHRLTTEHKARKGQYVTPIRIKRSVGIQAAPHIINKGILHASGNGNTNANAMKTIAPRPTPMVGVSSSRGNSMHGYDARKQSVPAPNVTFNTQMSPSNSSGVIPNTSLGVLGTSPTVSSQGGTIRPNTGPMLMVAQSGMMTLPRPTLTAGARPNQRPATIGASPGTLVKVPSSNATTQLLAINQGVGQVVLLPPGASGQPATAIVVSNMQKNGPLPFQSTGTQSIHNMSSPVVAQARIGGGGVGGSTPTNSRPVVAATTTTPSTGNQSMRHPAPLPKTPYQQVGGLTKKLPPQPTLKLSHKDNSIVLSWTMGKTEDHEAIASYQLYAYQEGTAAPSALLWKKVGSVKALELPMACTLTQFMPGHVYHFAVRAVDIKSRLGPFSDPRSIRLDR